MSESNTALIRERAYQLYLARSGGPGDAARDWLQAERELREQGTNHRGPAKMRDKSHHGRLTDEVGCDLENPT